MNIQVFPNKFKSIFLIIVIVGTIFGQGDDLAESFMEGFNEGFKSGADELSKIHQENDDDKTVDYQKFKSEFHYFENLFGGKNILKIINIITILSLLGYMMCKERYEDDYIKHLRLSSYQLAFVISIIFSFLMFVLNITNDNSYFDALINYLILYLIIFAIKKRRDLVYEADPKQ